MFVGKTKQNKNSPDKQIKPKQQQQNPLPNKQKE